MASFSSFRNVVHFNNTIPRIAATPSKTLPTKCATAASAKTPFPSATATAGPLKLAPHSPAPVSNCIVAKANHCNVMGNDTAQTGHEEQTPVLKIAIIGFGNFGQFIANGIERQGHIVLATSRSDYSEYCERHGIQFFQLDTQYLHSKIRFFWCYNIYVTFLFKTKKRLFQNSDQTYVYMAELISM